MLSFTITELKTNRLYFIDVVRAFAILMMLQGHFIDTLLAESYRDLNNVLYNTWRYFRGITAPTFFTISGLIFTYLLLKAKNNGAQRLRIKKGLNRGFLLIGIGYALRIPVFQWLSGYFGTYFLVVDVLQCIGLSLLLIIILYQLCSKNSVVFSLLCLGLGILIFFTEPFFREYTATNIPLIFANYVSKSNGSIFTILPWFGYILFGAFIATLFNAFLDQKGFKNYIITGFFGVGIFLIYCSTAFINMLFSLTRIQVLYEVAVYNYLFIRLGNVLVLFGLFYAFERFIKLPILLKIGQKTLSIYVIHFILLYGSFTGWGLNRVFGKTLNPLEAVSGALIFLILVSFISANYIKANTIVYERLKTFTRRFLKHFSHPDS